MQDKQSINKARAIYYNLFANFFIPSSDIQNYFEFFRLLNLLKDSSLDSNSEESIKNILNLLDKDSNQSLIQEYDDIFHNPVYEKVRQTASFYDEGVESGKKRVEMIQFVAKTKFRRDEKKYFEYEDSIGFIFSIMSELSNAVALGENEYENTIHCIFEQILNPFIDEIASSIYEHNKSNIYKELMVVLHSFIEFERVYLEVVKPVKKSKAKKQITDNWGDISPEERERREKNRALKALSPKN